METGLLHTLLFFMIVGALIAVETRNLLSAIISVGAVGFLLSIAFLLLGAPDIAITQVVVEILCLIILIRATISRDITTVSTGGREFFGTVVTVTVVLMLAIISLKVFAQFPAFGSSVLGRAADVPSHYYLAEGLRKVGAGNVVTAILLDFRGYDTLGEATVLFCSIVGALAILRKKARKKVEESDKAEA